MTQAICDITTDEVNVDVVVEPQADTMIEVANRAGGMEQVFHDNTLIGNGNSVDLGVNTEIIAPKEYVDEKVANIKVDAYTKQEVDNKFTVANAQIDANATAILKTRDDMNAEDGRLQTQITAHASAITTNKNDIDELGDQVAVIESKIPESASATNQLATKADLANIDLDGYVKKSGDTMTGNLSFDIVDDKYKNIVWNPESEVWVDDITVETRKYLVGPKIVSTGFDILQQYPTYQNASVELGGVSVESDRFYPAKSDGVMKLGLPNRRWDNVYTTNINNGNDLIVPTEGGTLARLEDLIDLRADINEADSELQTQITHQAAEIATKQDQLVAGDNIVISNNVISATGAGGGAGFDIQVVQELPATGQKGIIYLLAKDGAAPDIYDEYVWITATQTFELIGSTKVDLSDYLPLSGGTIKGVVKIQSGQGTGALWVGADTNGTTLTNNTRHLARIVVPSYSNVARGATLLGWDSSGDSDLPIANRTADVVSFGGSKKITNATSPMGISFCVAKTRESTAAADKVYPLAMDANAANFGVPVSAPDLTVGTEEGTINIGVVAGTATIATNNGLDIVAQTKFDTAPTTDDTTAWADVNSTALVTKQQVAAALSTAGGGASLPDQTGNAGKFLKTDGATASWANALENIAPEEYGSIVVGSGATTSKTARGAVVIGRNSGRTATGNGAVAIGDGAGNTSSAANSVAIGAHAQAGDITLSAIAIGAYAQAIAKNAIQLGMKSNYTGHTNSDENTFKVGNANGNFEMMSADGTIPAERMSATAGATGQVLTKTDTGMAWQDTTGGGASLPILLSIWSDRILSDMSWLRADTFSWQSGNVYKAAYDHLTNDMRTVYAWVDRAGSYGFNVYTESPTPSVGDSIYDENGSVIGSCSSFNSGSLGWTGSGGTTYSSWLRSVSDDLPSARTETIGDITITYYLAQDGHKICLPDQESNVVALYESTGVAWYYILDTENEQFKLPRTKYGFTGLRDSVGGYVEPALPNITGNAWARGPEANSSGSDGALYVTATSDTYGRGHSEGSATAQFNLDASRSSTIYKDGATVQPPATQMYLYFYVGNFEQSAVEQTAGINAEMFNDLNAHKVIESQNPTAENGYTWYRKYADGWVEQGGSDFTARTINAGQGTAWYVTMPVPMSDTKYNIQISFDNGNLVPAVNNNKQTSSTQVYLGCKNQSTGNVTSQVQYWQVSGMFAQ